MNLEKILKGVIHLENKRWKILLIEDDKIISNEIKSHMNTWGFDVKLVNDFTKIFDEFIDYNPELVLMDVTLPYYNGYYWTERIRKVSKVPIIFISAADENLNLIMAMNLGADDYLTKPFELEVLQAKINAILRRSYEYIDFSKDLYYKDVILKRDLMILNYKDRDIELTKNEFKILEILLEKPGKIYSREDIMNKIWQSDVYINDNTLTVNILRLRKKLEDNSLFGFIKTKKGVGYYV